MKHEYFIKRILILAIISMLVSCKVFEPSQMLRTKPGQEYQTYTDSIVNEYRIAPDDVINFIVLPNKGERIISGVSDQSQSNTPTEKSGLSYIIERDGTANMPLIGSTKFEGLTRREAEIMLEEKYAAYINNPYVKINVENRRVFVFHGASSTVFKLENQNTTLFEVLAQAGGTEDSKAHKIKLIRKVNNVPQVYLIDLSKIENVNQGNIIVQSNDVIYVTPRTHVTERIIATVTPYLSLLATAFAAIALFK
jgi:polysaccharide biosynthesis/export protein